MNGKCTFGPRDGPFLPRVEAEETAGKRHGRTHEGR